ncbi:MAG: hypothetical protein HY810_10430 [Candidatus Omnitrophica bacterium]|nr:hypothetical protein [Candidatus Omnitrophota bacterium]
MAEKIKQKDYTLRKNLVFLIHIAITFLFLFVMAFSFSRSFRGLAEVITSNLFIIITIYFFLFYAAYFFSVLGLKYYEDFFLENKWRNNLKDIKEWFRALVRKESKRYFILLLVVQVLYTFLEIDVGWWWIASGLLAVIAVSFYSANFSKYLLPLFVRCNPLADYGLKTRIIELSAKANIKVFNVDMIPGVIGQPDIALMGIGNVRRVVVAEQLLEYAHEEIGIILAREIAGRHFHHIRKILVLNTLIIMTGFFIINLIFAPVCSFFCFEFFYNIDTLPVLAGLCAVVFTVIIFILNLIKLEMEKETDIFVLKLTKTPDAFVSLLVRQMQSALENPGSFRVVELMLMRKYSYSSRILLAQDFAQNLIVEMRNKKK